MNSKTKIVRKAIIKGDIAYIPLGGKLGGVAIVDKENAWIDKYGWHQTPDGYAQAKINRKGILMHIFLFGKKDGLVNDHINRNRLDNRKSNIRKVTHSKNNQNIGISKNNTSGHNGISWYKPYNKWVASIWINYKRKTLGYYDNINDAIEARKQAEKKYWG